MIINRKKIALTITDIANYESRKYCSGIDQHIMFLYNYLRTYTCHDVFFFFDNVKKDEPKQININDQKNVLLFDIIIVVGIDLSDNIHKQCSENNIYTIFYSLGHEFTNETQLILKRDNTSALRIRTFDEVWISPHFGYSTDYYKYRFKTNKVFIAPYFWEPINISSPITKPLGDINIAILEPNLNYIKCCLIPIIICERAKKLINKAYSFGSLDLYNKSGAFRDFINQSELYHQKKLILDDRRIFSWIMTKRANVVISFVDNCDLNFIFFECFYLGIPLIHNSEMLKDWGFYYPKCDVEKAHEHIKYLKNGNFKRFEYIEKHKPLLYKYSMENSENMEFFSKLYTL